MRQNVKWMKGEINYVVPILIIIVIVAVFLCIFVVPPYYDNYLLERAFHAQAVLATKLTDEQIRAEAWKAVEDLNVPVPQQNIKVFRSGEMITVSAEYTITIPYINRELNMLAEVERPITSLK